jgi:hypothetical protein
MNRDVNRIVRLQLKTLKQERKEQREKKIKKKSSLVVLS